MTYLWVGLGSALGGMARYWMTRSMMSVSAALPWGTIVVNVLGCFVIGFFGTYTLAGGRHAVAEDARLFVMVGVCGGFTTFSSFSLQTLELLRGGAWMRAGANVLLSVALCLAAVGLGHVAAERAAGGTAIAQTDVEREMES